MKCVYIADDGTKFVNESECREYEFKSSIGNSNLIMLDCELNYIYDIEQFESCDYVCIKSNDDYDKLKALCEYVGLLCPDGIGSYYFDGDFNEWFSIDEKISTLESETSNFKNIKNLLEE